MTNTIMESSVVFTNWVLTNKIPQNICFNANQLIKHDVNIFLMGVLTVTVIFGLCLYFTLKNK
jgi:hypothetical protein